jgi:hypothetical protein
MRPSIDGLTSVSSLGPTTAIATTEGPRKFHDDENHHQQDSEAC